MKYHLLFLVYIKIVTSSVLLVSHREKCLKFAYSIFADLQFCASVEIEKIVAFDKHSSCHWVARSFTQPAARHVRIADVYTKLQFSSIITLHLLVLPLLVVVVVIDRMCDNSMTVYLCLSLSCCLPLLRC